MFKKIYIIILSILILWYSLWFEIPNPEWFVTDKSNILTDKQKVIISDLISNIRQETSSEIAVLIVPTIQWDNINLLWADIWNKRSVGDKDLNNWIVILISIEDRQRSIQIWYWLEATITDAIAKRIWEKNINPNFKQWNYFQWIYDTINQIYLYIQKDPNIIKKYSQSDNTISNQWSINIELLFFRWFAAAIISRTIVPKSKRKNRISRFITFITILSIWVILWYFISNFIISIIIWFIWMFFWIFWKWSNWSFGIWWFGGGNFWWNSGWWFGGGSFWWGWASGKR